MFESESVPKFINKKKEKTSEKIEYIEPTTRKIERGKNKADDIRIEKFNNFSEDITEAFCTIGTIFKNAHPKNLWEITGSAASFVEGQTTDHPADIDVIFAEPDYEKVLAEFQKLQIEGKIQDLKVVDMENFKNEKNGCKKIFARILTSSGKLIEVEAFAQNVDPLKPKNGINNPGLESTDINIYEKNNIEINFSDREGIYKFYLQVAYIEFQKYQIDDRCLTKIKNKFPLRLQKLISLILGEKFEKKVDSDQLTKDQRPNIEIISDEDINKLIDEFLEHNTKNKALELSDASHSSINPAVVLKKLFDDFRLNRYNEVNIESKGFVQSEIESKSFKNREEVIFALNKEQLEGTKEILGMNELTKKYTTLNTMNKTCEKTKTCDKEAIEKMTLDADTILKELCKVKLKYEKYLEKINYKDNRDFIPYVSFQAILEEFINPTIELAIKVQSKISKNVYSPVYA